MTAAGGPDVVDEITALQTPAKALQVAERSNPNLFYRIVSQAVLAIAA
jgi:hypothetical protein